MNLDRLNSLASDEAFEDFLKVGGSSNWAKKMYMRRPFENEHKLFAAAEEVWKSLSAGDWLEAFSSHPRIGDQEALQRKFASTAWAVEEQAAGKTSSPETLETLALENKNYEKKFGYIFIICATGKTAEEMLKALLERMGNDPKREIQIAANEQLKIIKLRLEKHT